MKNKELDWHIFINFRDHTVSFEELYQAFKERYELEKKDEFKEYMRRRSELNE